MIYWSKYRARYVFISNWDALYFEANFEVQFMRFYGLYQLGPDEMGYI